MTKILYLDMDGVLVNFDSALLQVPAGTLAEYAGHPDDIPGLFSLMKPLPDGLSAYFQLQAWFDTYLLSTAPWENPSAWSDKLLWVKRYLGKPAIKRLIITHHKNLNRGDFLVDDRTRHGADHFLGEHIHFGTPQFPDWSVVLPYLLERAG